jgi:hypothetical protein
MVHLRNVQCVNVVVAKTMAYLASKNSSNECSDCHARFINRNRLFHRFHDRTLLKLLIANLKQRILLFSVLQALSLEDQFSLS